VTDALATEIREAGGRALEAGIGTGRIARPLLARGIRITGVDISPRMLRELRAQLTPAHAGPGGAGRNSGA
jgi:ubiquinone/menaquinone biosynthesis C-methylase UbiE